MNAIFWWLVQNTIAIVLLIPLAAAVCRLFRNRPAVQHVLWAVVLLKFITPPVVSWPLSIEGLWPSFQSPTTTAIPAAPEQIHAYFPDASSSETKDHGAAENPRGYSGSASLQDAFPSGSFSGGEKLVRSSLWTLSAVWLLGMAGSAVRQLRRIARHAQLVQRAREAPPQLTAEIEAIARGVGLRPPRAIVARGIASPFMWFLGRLRLVWPEVMSSREAVIRARGVIAHELAHIRRGDHILAWIELVAGIIWWWNPLFWFVRRRVRESAELACDAIALGAWPDGRRTYAELLLELSTGLCPGAPAPALGMSAGSPSSFERRLSMILSDRVSSKVSLWGLLAAGSFALAAVPGWTFAQKPAENTATSTVETARQVDQDASTTAARLEEIEAELKRLSGLLEEAKRSAVNDPHRTAARTQSRPRSGVVDGGKPKDDARLGEFVTEALVTGAGPDQNRIALFRERLAGLEYNKNERRPNRNTLERPALAFGNGYDRIYILNTDVNETKQCFLSAQTKQARPVWRTTFFNPLLTERFSKVWQNSFNSPLPSSGLAGNWQVEESDDHWQVVVTWTGTTGVRVRLCFAMANGELQAEDFMPAEVGKGAAAPVDMDRGKGAGNLPPR